MKEFIVFATVIVILLMMYSARNVKNNILSVNGNSRSKNINYIAEGFADRVGGPIGDFASGGGLFLDDVNDAVIYPDGSVDTIWGGKSGENKFVGGCCSMVKNGNCLKCALSVNGDGSTISGINVADNLSKLNFHDLGDEPLTMANAVGNDRAYLSPTPYMPSGTNLVPAGDPYTPQYSQYNPLLY